MTTTTAPAISRTAPTEAEIREALRLRNEIFETDKPLAKIREGVYGLASLMHSPAYAVLESEEPRDPDEEADASAIWSFDLRPSEAKRLQALSDEAEEAATAAAVDVVTEIIVAAALKFAQEYPDAPRAIRRPVPA